MIALKIPPAGEKAYERNGAMKITFLGTGNAQATACYNTCFVMEEGGKCLLVDGGGGNLLLRRLQDTGYKWQDMRDIIVTHKHIDHLLGIICICFPYRNFNLYSKIQLSSSTLLLCRL